jgi:hypothetical protein
VGWRLKKKKKKKKNKKQKMSDMTAVLVMLGCGSIYLLPAVAGILLKSRFLLYFAEVPWWLAAGISAFTILRGWTEKYTPTGQPVPAGGVISFFAALAIILPGLIMPLLVIAMAKRERIPNSERLVKSLYYLLGFLVLQGAVALLGWL